MRVAYICADPDVSIFGKDSCSVRIEERLAALRHFGADVQIFTASHKGHPSSQMQNFEIHPLPLVQTNDPVAQEETCLALNQELPQILRAAGVFDLYYERYSLWNYSAMEFAQSLGKPAILEINDRLGEQNTRGHLIRIEEARDASARAFASATKIIAISKQTATYLRQFEVNRSRIHVIPNGVNPNRFPHGLRASLPGAPGSFTIGTIRALKASDGLNDLVDAFELIRREDAKIRLLIVGDGPAKSELVSMLSKRALMEATDFTGPITARQIPGLLASFDVAVAGNSDDCSAYLEYMVAGLPVVASANGPMKDVIQDEINGLLYPEGHSSALARTIARLKTDPILRSRLGQAARITVLRKYTWQTVVHRILRMVGLQPDTRTVALH